MGDALIDWRLRGQNPMRVEATTKAREATFAEVLGHWSEGFGHVLAACLKSSALTAAFFECAPLNRKRLAAPFEAVLLPAPSLARIAPNHRPFKDLFDREVGSRVIAFDSLGRDARLIAPRPDGQNYAHLMNFLTGATGPLIDDFFCCVATEMMRLVGDSPRWLSTSGLGVSWLHFRIDSRPKYYQYQPFRNSPNPADESALPL